MPLTVHSTLPDLELESLFKKNFTQLTYLKGSVMNPVDLERTKVNFSSDFLKRDI